MKCDLCGNDAVTFVRYNGTHLCSEHFIDYVERRVKKEIRKGTPSGWRSPEGRTVW